MDTTAARVAAWREEGLERALALANMAYHPPTPWDEDGAVEYVYDVLNLPVDACVETGDIPIVGSDLCLHDGP